MAQEMVEVRPRGGLGGARAGILVLALACFAAVSTEMMPVGLLPDIGRAFGVSAATAGLLVSLYAVMVAVLAVPLTLATRRLRGKHLLVAAMAGYAASNLVVALAPDFGVLALGRTVGGVTHALFFSVCIGYATRLVPSHQTGRALALSSAGVSAGFVLGVPLATALGNAVGWRAAFVALTAVALVTLALIVTVLPDIRSVRAERVPVGRRTRQLVAVVASDTFTFLGHYALYTYVSILLLRSGAGPAAVGPILLVFGAFGLVGLGVAGRHLDHRLRRTALTILLVVALGIAASGAAYPTLALVIVAGCVWNGAFGSAASLYQAAAVRTRATSPELAGAWINALSNVGIAGGAALGAALLGPTGARGVAAAAAVLVAMAAVVVLLAPRAFPDGR